MCLSSTARLFVYLRQNSQKNSFGNLAYSWGNGLEYQVSTSYRPKTMAAGFLDPFPEALLLGLVDTVSSSSPLVTVNRAALSRASLNRSTSFCVTPGGKVCGRIGSSVSKIETYWLSLCSCEILATNRTMEVEFTDLYRKGVRYSSSIWQTFVKSTYDTRVNRDAVAPFDSRLLEFNWTRHRVEDKTTVRAKGIV